MPERVQIKQEEYIRAVELPEATKTYTQIHDFVIESLL